ncbi:MAG: pimeloyl-ACP methyl ester carboxylesterase [Cryomorphaceae bacterium]|jgi:pimeloyl-ACP methyl ester carboxylesterase
MKIFKISSLVVLILICLLLVLLWTPGTSRQQMEQKYAGSSSDFATLSDGSRIHFRDQGNNSGPALVLVHGTGASLHTWEPLIDLLKADFRLVSLDLPAHGLTGATQGRKYSHSSLVAAVWQVMDELELEKASLVGNSLGGAVVWKAALSSPDRVKSLIMLAPSGAPRKTKSKSNIGFRIMKTSLGRTAMLHITPRFIIKASLQQTIEDDSLVTNAMIDRYWELLRMDGNRQAMADLSVAPRSQDAWRELDQINNPSLIIWGENDGLLPVDMAATFVEKMPNETLVVFPGIGHLPMEEAAVKTSAEIRKFCVQNDC